MVSRVAKKAGATQWWLAGIWSLWRAMVELVIQGVRWQISWLFTCLLLWYTPHLVHITWERRRRYLLFLLFHEGELTALTAFVVVILLSTKKGKCTGTLRPESFPPWGQSDSCVEALKRLSNTFKWWQVLQRRHSMRLTNTVCKANKFII